MLFPSEIRTFFYFLLSYQSQLFLVVFIVSFKKLISQGIKAISKRGIKLSDVHVPDGFNDQRVALKTG